MHVVVIDDGRPGQLVSPHPFEAVPPANLSQPLSDGQTITIEVTATDSKGNPLSLKRREDHVGEAGSRYDRAGEERTKRGVQSSHQRIRHDTLGVTVVFPGQVQKYTASATVMYSPRG